MHIIVCPKKDLRSQWYTNKNWFFNPQKIFITIAGLADGCEYPCPYLANDKENSHKVLRLLFDDVTESEADNPCVINFTTEHAKRIKDFINSFKESYHWFDGELYVNCAAGISRSAQRFISSGRSPHFKTAKPSLGARSAQKEKNL